MTVELTDIQQRALDSEGMTLGVIDPRTSARYVLVPFEDFETMRELMEDDRAQRAIRRVALRNAAGRMEDEP